MSLVAALGSLLVRNGNSIDFEATAAAVKAALANEIEATAARDSEIEATLDSVYDKLGVDIYQTPELVAMTAATLVGNDLAKMAGVSEEVRGFLSRTPRFKGERGRKGGLRRFSK